MNTVKKMVKTTGTGTSSALALIDARKNWLLAIGCTAVKTGTSTTTNAWGLFGNDIGIVITNNNYVRIGRYSTEEYSTSSYYNTVLTGSTGSGTDWEAYCYEYPIVFDGFFSLKNNTNAGDTIAFKTTINSKEVYFGCNASINIIATSTDYITSSITTNFFPANTQSKRLIYVDTETKEPILYLMPLFIYFNMTLENYGIYDGVIPDAYRIIGNYDTEYATTYFIDGDAYFYLPTLSCLYKYKET